MSNTRATPASNTADSNPLCGTCKWFSRVGEQCRRNPPQAFIVPGNNPGQIATLGVWPPVASNKFCGQHEAEYTLT
jgi:hypothetical protein